ncbi:MAG: hypothetical protein JXQ75_02615 [Phycisphaerae bacterium]|nr:hypothetical protein [Phycisphaerae bacterium]
MTCGEEQRVSLGAMSARQRRLVERHLPLVHLTLRRHGDLARLCRAGREPSELLQEGCLALMEAVRAHDPARHGHFASFAMARIHYAMSRYAHEQSSLIRIPFITQRRRKNRLTGGPPDRHHPDALPRVVRMSDDRKTPSQKLVRRLYAEAVARRRDGVTIGDLVRECYDRAAAQVVSRMKSSPRCTTGLRKLVDRCSRERWTVPEPDARTPVRQLADALGCSMGRVTHCEERFRKKVAAVLQADLAYGELRRIGRRRTEGWRHRLTRRELASLRRLQAEDASPA